MCLTKGCAPINMSDFAHKNLWSWPPYACDCVVMCLLAFENACAEKQSAGSKMYNVGDTEEYVFLCHSMN